MRKLLSTSVSSCEETRVLIASLRFSVSFRAAALRGQLNLPRFSAYVECAPIPKAIYFDCNRCQGINLTYSGFYGNPLHQLCMYAYETKGKWFFALLKPSLPPDVNMPLPHTPTVDGFTFQRDGMRSNLKPSKHTLIDLCSSVCYLGGCLLCCVVFFGVVPKKPRCPGQSLLFDRH